MKVTLDIGENELTASHERNGKTFTLRMEWLPDVPRSQVLSGLDRILRTVRAGQAAMEATGIEEPEAAMRHIASCDPLSQTFHAYRTINRGWP